MDSVTQALFGASIAVVGFRRGLGRRTVLAGALLGTLPDLDVAVGWVADGYANWRHHRGLTHSLFFAPVAGPLIGWGIARWEAWRRGAADPARRRAWIALSVLVLATHPVIDLFTSYGTQLLAPFSDHRFAIDAMPIIDPIYSLPLLLAALLASLSRRPGPAVLGAAAALFFAAGWTLYAWSLEARTREIARAQLAAQGIAPTELRAYAQLFQPWYRRVVAEVPGGVLVGYHTLLDPAPIAWRRYERMEDPRIAAVAATPEGRLLEWFALGRTYWRLEPTPTGATVEGFDIRYGMMGAELGFWGIGARLDAAGQLQGRPEIFTRRPPAGAQSLRRFWRAVTTAPGVAATP